MSHTVSLATPRSFARAWGPLAFAYTILVAAAFGILTVREYRVATATWQERLQAAALTRRDMLGTWWDERFGDARILVTDRVIRQALTGGDPAAAVRRMQDFANAYGYYNLSLTDDSGAPLAILRPNYVVPIAVKRAVLLQSRPHIRVTSSEQDSVLVQLIVPIAPSDSSTSAGLLVVTIDPNVSLFPLLTEELGGTSTGETMLVEQRDGAVTVFSPLRAPAPRTLPASTPALAVGTPLLSSVTFGRFKDNRGTDVLAAGILDTTSGWGLVRLVSEDEAFSGARMAVRTYLLLTLLVLVLGFWFMYRTWLSSTRMEEATADATRQHRLEHDRRIVAEEVGRRFARLLDSSVEEAYVFDGQSLQFQMVNGTALRQLQYAEPDLLRRGPPDIAPDLDIPAFRAELSRLWDTESRRHGVFEWEQVRRDGSRYPVEAVVHPDRAAESPTFFMLVRDIADRRHLEQQLRESQKLEAVGRLAGGVAHDFNNILTAIIVSAELARPVAASQPGVMTELDEILKAGDRAKALTTQLLAFGRRQIMRAEMVSLPKVVRGIEPMIRRLTPANIDMIAVLHSTSLVKADVGMLEQVLTNLVLNAMHAMPDGGRLTIEATDVVLDASYARRRPVVSEGRYVMLSVSDTGVGMSSETRSRLFEPFFTTKAAGKGTGLGLSVVHGIINQFGGHIWVYSEPDQGTTFKVYLPAVASDAAPGIDVLPETVPVPARQTDQARTVLLVEDDPSVRRVTARILEGAGFTVLQAEDGEQALAVGREHPGTIHLLITDVVMPRMGGRRLADRLATSRPGVPVLYLSGFTDNAVVHHGILDEGTNFLQKPFLSKSLLDAVFAVLDGPV